MISIGECQPYTNGAWWEVHLFDRDSAVAVLKNSIIDVGEVKEQNGALMGCRLLLKIDDSKTGALLSKGRELRILAVGDEQQEPVWLFQGKIDYVETRRAAPSGPLDIEVHARGPGATLIDEGFCGEVSGTLSELVEQLTKVEPIIDVSMPTDSDCVRAWIDAGSIFGAVQLVAVTLGGVVASENRDRFSITTREEDLARMDVRPAVVIDENKVERFSMREGMPVRGLSEDD
ncbi:MAG: hypothetical protein FWD73_08860 [Polyangiaceae bacterium]|nr:hypothetical protein [Polyangiaceae bacterium]